MKKLPIPIPNLPEAISGLKRRMGQLVAWKEDSPFEEQQSPFDKYYRNKFLQKLNLQEVNDQSVLEVGCGAGDLLKMASKFEPRELYGIDEEEEALGIARDYLEGVQVDLSVAPIYDLPFPDQSFDLVYAVYELQHQLGENLDGAITEVCRVSRQWVILVEETAREEFEEEDLIYRPVEQYKALFKQNRFYLRQTKYLDAAFSRTMYGGGRSPWVWVRWIFSPLLYLIGFPASWMKFPGGEVEAPSSKFALFLQKLTLPLMSGLDDVFLANKGVTIMRFERERIFRRG